jgi:predicted MFS family arabinose efflux permease
MDLTGALLVTAGFSSLVYGIVRTDALGWGAFGVLGPIGVGLALLAAFAVVEGRLSQAPLMPLGIFRLRRLRAANAVVLALYSAVFVMWFFLSLYDQQVLGFDAIQTGLGFLPMTLSVALASTLAPRLTAAIGARWTLTLGMVASAVGLLLLTGIAPGGSYAGSVLPGGMLSAAGLGLALVPATIVAVQGVPRSQAGLASGLLNTSRLLGGALGLAVLSTIAASHSHSELANGTAGLRALTDGYSLALTVGAIVCGLGAAAAALLLRDRAPREGELLAVEAG